MNNLENRRVAPYFPPAYYLSMGKNSFRDRTIAEMDRRSITKAELSRRSGVPYHALDKFLKGTSSSTSIDNATSIANALGIPVDTDSNYDELRELYHRLDEQEQQFLIASARGLLK